jgi:hypothetical protein
MSTDSGTRCKGTVATCGKRDLAEPDERPARAPRVDDGGDRSVLSLIVASCCGHRARATVERCLKHEPQMKSNCGAAYIENAGLALGEHRWDNNLPQKRPPPICPTSMPEVSCNTNRNSVLRPRRISEIKLGQGKPPMSHVVTILQQTVWSGCEQ